MKEYHGHKDSHYWVSASEIEAKAAPKPQPTKKAAPKYKNFTAIENGETVYYSVRVSEPVRIGSIMI